ncbi:MAG: alpha/beta fold hydrolase [Wenzhouxiangellaceae bacterium]
MTTVTLALALLATVQWAVASPPPPPGPDVLDPTTWPGVQSCQLESEDGRLSVKALCGTLEVPENRERPDGRVLELAWAVVEARRPDPSPDPVFFLAGGPGQSARDAAAMISTALKDVNLEHHLIFLDQRGTGASNALNCEFDESITFEADTDQAVESLKRCLASLDAAPEHYTTLDAADDLEALRRHLGLGPVNLIGGSYGTRMAQVYLRRYPDAVRSVVLDGIVPTRLALGAEHAAKLDQAITRLIDRCVSDTACAERFGDLRSDFEVLKQRYAEQGQRIELTHPRTGVVEEFNFNRAVLGSALRFLAYQPETQAMIPLLVHESLESGDPTRLSALAMMTIDQISSQIAIGLNFSVGCSEDWPYWPRDTHAEGTLLGDSFTELYRQVCEFWPSKPVGPDFHQPFDTPVPILLLSGELDPVTPPEYGEEAHAQYSNSLHLVGSGRGHIVMTHPCFGRIIAQFIEDAGFDALDTGCLDELGPEPFFLDLLGPAP